MIYLILLNQFVLSLLAAVTIAMAIIEKKLYWKIYLLIIALVSITSVTCSFNKL